MQGGQFFSHPFWIHTLIVPASELYYQLINTSDMSKKREIANELIKQFLNKGGETNPKVVIHENLKVAPLESLNRFQSFLT